MPQTIRFDVAYMLEEQAPFVVGGLVTAKPNGSVWNGEEIAPNMALVSIDVDFATAVEIGHDLLLWKVDDINAPTQAVRINP